MRTLTIPFFFALVATLAGCGSVVIRSEPDTDGGVTDQPIASDRPIAEDGPRFCATNAECGPGTECVGGEGCGVPWTCQPATARPCTADYSPFCGCDGSTFYGSSSCPLRPFAHRGACEMPPPPVDAGPGGCVLPDGTVCAVGTTCRTGECSTCFCAAPGTLRCLGGCVDAGPPPQSCRGNVDCPAGSICAGEPGCDVPWTCRPAPPCTRDLATYCSCDGSTFMASSSCPGRPYDHRGACGIVPPDAGADTCTVGGVTCRVGVPCRIDACTTCVCGGDTVSCGVDADCQNDAGVMDGGVAPPPFCPAQDARGVGMCAAFFGYAWNGSDCVGLGGCSCVGSDCRSLSPSLDRCNADHRACPRPL